MPSLLEEKKILIGLNIGYYRRARHMTQIELAESLNISSNYLSQVERGCKSLSLDKLLQLAEILSVDETPRVVAYRATFRRNSQTIIQLSCCQRSLPLKNHRQNFERYYVC